MRTKMRTKINIEASQTRRRCQRCQTQRVALQRIDSMPDKAALREWADDEWRRRWNIIAEG